MNASSTDDGGSAQAPLREPARRRLCLALAGSAALLPVTHPAAARPAIRTLPLEVFGPDSWARLRTELARPAIVAFTATWCPHCPAVIAALADASRARAASLVVVVVDGAGRADLPAALPYRLADRLFVFEGNETALRHGVDARWRGVLPYVALLGADGSPPVFVAGMPSAETLGRWATRHSSPSSSGSS